MKKRLIIVGAGGLGHEVLGYAAEILAKRREIRVGGFLDDDDSAVATDGVPLLGRIEDYQPEANDVFVVAIGRPSIRRAVTECLARRGARFTSLIHPRAHIATTARIEPGSVISPFAFVAEKAVVGPHAYLNVHTSTGHDAVIGRYSVLSPFAAVSGGAQLGEAVFLGTHATVGPECQVGSHSTLSGGAVVLVDLEANTFAAPAAVTLSRKAPPA